MYRYLFGNRLKALVVLFGSFLSITCLWGADQAWSTNPPFRIGINFPFRGREVAPMQTYLALLNEMGARGMRQFIYGDVFWGTVEPQDNQWQFTDSDSALFNPYNIYPIPTLYTMGTSVNGNGLQVPWRACNAPGCGWEISRDSADSRDYVQTVVQRYRNRTHFWEIANEMDGHTHRPEGLPVNEFAQFMILNDQWTKAVDPQAMVLLPGLLGTYGLPRSTPQKWLRDFLDAGGGEGFDILNYHDYNAWWTLPAHYDSLKAILDVYGYGNKPIWVTECSISSDPTVSITPEYASLDEQAADVWRRSAVLFARGVQTWFWHSFWSSGGQSEWREFGLLDAEGNPKKSYYAYKLLLEKIEGFQEARALSFGNVTEDNSTGGDGVWVVQFSWADGTQRWVMWSPDNRSYDFLVQPNAEIQLTKVVPIEIIADSNKAVFDVVNMVATDTVLTIQLSAQPVLVEVTYPTGIRSPDALPAEFTLLKNFPNPFNPFTTIEFELQRGGQVELVIFNVRGQKIRTLINRQRIIRGRHWVQWDGRDESGMVVPSGVYLYRLKVGQQQAVRRMVFLQ